MPFSLSPSSLIRITAHDFPLFYPECTSSLLLHTHHSCHAYGFLQWVAQVAILLYKVGSLPLTSSAPIYCRASCSLSRESSLYTLLLIKTAPCTLYLARHSPPICARTPLPSFCNSCFGPSLSLSCDLGTLHAMPRTKSFSQPIRDLLPLNFVHMPLLPPLYSVSLCPYCSPSSLLTGDPLSLLSPHWQALRRDKR